MPTSRVIELAVLIIEHVGVAVIALGGVLGLGLAWRDARRDGNADFYSLYRRHLGHAIILGLEILVASDIIRTVSHAPELRQVAGLALIVAIRTFLSFAMHVELNGRWPWQAAPVDGSRAVVPKDSR